MKKCAASDCKEKFAPRTRTHLYHSRRCKNREAARRSRDRHNPDRKRYQAA